MAKIVLDSQDYPDLNQLRSRIRAVNPRISVATIYRTLGLLVGLGLIERHTFRGSPARYGPALEQHRDHLVDVTSGRVIEFRSEEIERLQDDIARHLGFRLTGHRLELYGEPVRAPKRHSLRAAARRSLRYTNANQRPLHVRAGMSALGQKQTFERASAMSALPPKSGHRAAQDASMSS